MTSSLQRRTLVYVALVSGLTALAFVGTLVIRIPVPATTGYFNLGDIFVIFAGLWLGPAAGLVVGSVGPTLADAIGFPVFIPATLITKGLEGLVAGLLARRARDGDTGRLAFAAYVSGFLVVAGYFVFEAFVYPVLARTFPAFAVTDVAAAYVEILPNSAQWLVGATVALGLRRAVPAFMA